MEIENRLRALGYEIPEGSPAVAKYVRHVQVGETLFLGGTIGRIGDRLAYQGKLGESVTTEQGYVAARNCMLSQLAFIKAALGDLDRVERIVKVIGFINVAPGYNEMSRVLDGASDLLEALWGERGAHVRAAIGVAALGNDAPVEVEMTIQVR